VTSSPTTYFGGPDKTKNLLRDTLVEYIEAVPTNGHISWLCYYIHDPVIFQALIDASERGVKIDLIIDGRPRSPSINQACIDRFSPLKHCLINLIIVKKKPLWEYLGIRWHPHLHSKLYYFSHPTPRVLVGSYNPTCGKEHLDEASIQKIGDHSISHNVLVKIDNQDIVICLKDYILDMQNYWRRKFSRVLSSHNSTHRSQQWSIDFLPRFGAHPINTLLSKNHSNAKIKCAISHLKGPGILTPLKIAIKSGKEIELLLESSRRRVPNKHLTFLDKHQIKYYQPRLKEHCLMHNKFILYQSDQEHCVMFGSFNWSARSRILNHEVIACCYDKEVISAFELRWNQMITQH